MTDFQGEFSIVNSEDKLNHLLTELANLWNEHKFISVQVKTGKTRTQKQNAALHVYLRMLADELNNQGITIQQFFDEGYEMPWTPEIVKDNIWRVIQKAVIGEEKTSKAERPDYSKVYDILNKKLSESGIHIPWPEKND